MLNTCKLLVTSTSDTFHINALTSQNDFKPGGNAYYLLYYFYSSTPKAVGHSDPMRVATGAGGVCACNRVIFITVYSNKIHF